jgi:hypothetical protein
MFPSAKGIGVSISVSKNNLRRKQFKKKFAAVLLRE